MYGPASCRSIAVVTPARTKSFRSCRSAPNRHSGAPRRDDGGGLGRRFQRTRIDRQVPPRSTRQREVSCDDHCCLIMNVPLGVVARVYRPDGDASPYRPFVACHRVVSGICTCDTVSLRIASEAYGQTNRSGTLLRMNVNGPSEEASALVRRHDRTRGVRSERTLRRRVIVRLFFSWSRTVRSEQTSMPAKQVSWPGACIRTTAYDEYHRAWI